MKNVTIVLVKSKYVIFLKPVNDYLTKPYPCCKYCYMYIKHSPNCITFANDLLNPWFKPFLRLGRVYICGTLTICTMHCPQCSRSHHIVLVGQSLDSYLSSCMVTRCNTDTMTVRFVFIFGYRFETLHDRCNTYRVSTQCSDGL